jgi:Protein of unknown function (DUF3052)
MGREAKCDGEFDGWTGPGRLLLETDDLIFRGPKRFAIARRSIESAVAAEAWLEIRHAGGLARFDLGSAAARWAHDINHPRSRIDKLDVKPTSRVVSVALKDADFAAELKARAARVDARLGAGPYDFIFFHAAVPAELERLPDLRQRLQPAGAVWILTPKGVREMGHDPIVRAAKAAGLVDVKTARFSDALTALKLVIPRDRR